jgi:hypothetical protein
MPDPTFPPASQHDRTCSCPNVRCPRRGPRGTRHIAHRSWTGQDQHIERWRGNACGQAFAARRGTLMEATKLPEATVERRLQGQRWGVCDAGTADLCGVDLKTVPRFQTVAAHRAQTHHAQVTRDLRVGAVQRDARHAKRRGPPVEWRQTAMALSSRVVRWVHGGPRTQENAALLMAQVVARWCGVPGWLSDGWKAYPAARLQVLGQVYRGRRRGRRGRHPQPRLGPPRARFSGQVVTVREGTGKRLRGVTRVVYGGPRRVVQEMAGRGLRPSIQTAFMERWYGTLRGLCAPLRRRPRCRSASPRRHRARVWLVVDLDNVVLPHRSLRQEGRPRTPAMATERAQHVWSDRDDIWSPVPPDPLDRQLMQQRVKDLFVPALEAESPM